MYGATSPMMSSQIPGVVHPKDAPHTHLPQTKAPARQEQVVRSVFC